MLPAACAAIAAAGGDAVVGAAAVGAAAVSLRECLDDTDFKSVLPLDLSDYIDRLSLIFPYVRFVDDFIGAVPAVDFPRVSQRSLEVGNKHIQKVSQERSDIESIPVDRPTVLANGANLLDVMKEGNVLLANSLVALDQRFERIDRTLYLLVQSVVSSLANIQHVLSHMLENQIRDSASFSLIAQNIDNLSIISSEIYGVLSDVFYREEVVEEDSVRKKKLLKLTDYLSRLAIASDVAVDRDVALKDHLSFLSDRQTIRDLDGNPLVRLSPRELEAIKNASVAREKTDTINFELDDDDFDIAWVGNIDLLAFEKFSDILKEIRDQNMGSNNGS